ncbi:ferric reductase NAD binding domain-containing protein [Cantharellus anzutake]|uniref:ferric reductase NAD binding domain-containing protein n=1 Tax=Cantharellus anzutake TaxID=1750568 RepID=UPI001907A603|nr:ferric reductase NAD binding domain-containing protein [Cantharellus anzutake]KAF8324797.1 ferric reductase NAD binding domain-containing protein [Cantharellus anzutake]
MSSKSWLRREILSLRRLAFNVFFYGTHLGLFAYGWYSQYANERLVALNTLRYSVWVSRGAALVLAYDAALIILPVLRNILRIIRPTLAWLAPMDQSIWFHRQVAYSMAFWTMVHTTSHYINFMSIENTRKSTFRLPGFGHVFSAHGIIELRAELAVQIHYNQAAGITGHFMLFIMLIMYTTAARKVRDQCFEAFWYTHHLAFFFFLALYSHATGCFVRDTPEPVHTKKFPFYDANHCLGYGSWHFTVGPAMLYIGERIWREIRGRKYTKLTKVLVHPSGALELRMVKPSLKYVPGQWIFLQVPSVSAYQWHPFSITSAPEDPYVSVTICQVGDWTRALGDAVSAGPSVVAALAAATQPSQGTKDLERSAFGLPELSDQFYEVVASDESRPISLPEVRLDGPYGAPSEDVFKSDLAVLVGAGIGVAPFASILKHIWYRQRAGRLEKLKHVEFIWICRDAVSFAWFQSVLTEIEDAQIDPNFLRINMYVTQSIGIDQLYNIAINDTGSVYDPLTKLRSRTFYGRPDFKSIYSRIRSAVETGALLGPRESGTAFNVGTFYCGPSALAKTVKSQALACSTSTATFTFAQVRISINLNFDKNHY